MFYVDLVTVVFLLNNFHNIIFVLFYACSSQTPFCCVVTFDLFDLFDVHQVVRSL